MMMTLTKFMTELSIQLFSSKLCPLFSKRFDRSVSRYIVVNYYHHHEVVVSDR